MNTNISRGIDYSGHDSTINRDIETGIRYGVIPQNAIYPDSLGQIFEGRNLGYELAESELKNKLRDVLSDYFSDYKHNNVSQLDMAVEDAFNSLDDWTHNLELNGPYYWTEKGYALQTNDCEDVWVFKSPFYTHAQFCSPCAPGACYLLNPCEQGEQAYCLGHDWFEDGTAPYPVFSVKTNEEIQPKN